MRAGHGSVMAAADEGARPRAAGQKPVISSMSAQLITVLPSQMVIPAAFHTGRTDPTATAATRGRPPSYVPAGLIEPIRIAGQ